MELLERIWEFLQGFFGGLLGTFERTMTGLFGSSNARYIKKLQAQVDSIGELESKYEAMTDEQLREQTQKFRERLRNEETLEDILIEAFAVCREGGKRFLNMRHYDVQLIGGMVLHSGSIAEMVTGEGKTLVATLPAYLNALEGKGVHVITVNDYLARRDMEWMAPLYMGLGLTVDAIQSEMQGTEGTRRRQSAYSCDITYGTNNEFGFDYLRDNMRPAARGDSDYPEAYQQSQGPLNYAIIDDEIVIVDEATGRISEGRRWSRGIHQAIEAKERVEVTLDSQTQAKVTVQSYVSRYPLIAGMTGTASTASKEFKKFYRMPVSVIPPNRKSQRDIKPIVFCKTEQEKWTAVVNDIKKVHTAGRPILVGTRSIAKSELISHLLQKENVNHAVLNARHVESEADIISIAGQKGRVTVATNMAGRGTDIKIDDEVGALGGLHVIGTEMHDSARIDRQLLGRCGRQGDPGSFRQYISADDKLIETAYGRASANRYRTIGKIRSNRWWISLFEKAQRKVENQHYRSRKMLMYNEKMLAKSHQEMGLDPILDVYD